MWSSFIGDKDFSDVRLKSFSYEQLDLARFRVVYGVPAQSINDLHRLLAWMDRNQISPIDLMHARKWIDPSKEEPLQCPSKKLIWRQFGVFFVSIICFTVLTTTFTAKTTLFKMKVSEVWFSSNGSSVDAIWGRWKINSESCMKRTLPGASVSKMTDAETLAICDGLANGKLEAVTIDAIEQQRTVLGTIAVLTFLAALKLLHRVIAALRARELIDQLRSKENAPCKLATCVKN